MTALMIGCGSKFGLNLLQELLKHKWTVYSITGSIIESHCDLYQLTIDWDTYNQATIEKFIRSLPPLDLVFFNQNATALDDHVFDNLTKLQTLKLEKHWTQRYFSSCILPFHIVQSVKLNSPSKVVWMLSSYIYNHKEIKYADYLGNKFQNYIIMKNFSKTNRSCFMGINPENLNDDYEAKILVNLLQEYNPVLNGKVVYMDGTEDRNFDKFTQK